MSDQIPNDLLTAWREAVAQLRARDSFMENVQEARANGYDLVCSECGAGIYDDADLHDESCSAAARSGEPR